MKKKVGVIDYGAGNLRSVVQALNYIGSNGKIVAGLEDIEDFSHLILPGVGSFKTAMQSLQKSGLDQEIRNKVNSGTPILGICLGMQLLANRSSENGETEGLKLIDGDVDQFGDDLKIMGLKIPNVGFTTVETNKKTRLFTGLGTSIDFYFTHSYRLQCKYKKTIAAKSWHGEHFVAAVEDGQIAGTQFHPEKSQANGLRLIANFLEKF
ncbi:imidazole glycerol phosphate synthase, glutamine amidotransferase subunit [Synechococcus sp. BL107]|uniref:imidazole glycerol phosphate synthase subunit HisH n=1 Tax=Synechococcus sp. BL107 TaxID=313625 RepID=UPI0000E53C5F|nr:imidazole glycerol phosphate synthase subunit HisH [Synechococcus sp. BL107]EAU71035.1 imidazole glycerol phosphate synthase, glutamine amidotransferase subunit [Synechococcus sp. BL107]